MNTTDPTLPNYVRPEAAAVRPDLDLMADLLAGTRRIWERAREAKYLRKWKDEAQEVYDIRRECESVFEGLGRTLSACVGMLFAKPPAIEWNQSETAMAEHWPNLDGMGTSGPVLAKRFGDMAIRDGIGLILVDHPPTPAGVVVTAANEEMLGLRPMWALYHRAQAISWRCAMVHGAMCLTQLVLEECTTEPVGAYGMQEVKRYRVLTLVPGEMDTHVATWALWRETKDTGAGGFVREKFGTFRNRAGKRADRLPVAMAYTGRTTAPVCATLPLLGVAWANLSHWRLATALTFAREVASYAQGVIVGQLATTTSASGATVPGRVKLGPLALIHLVGEGASFEWKAPPTEAFGPLERGIQEKLTQMGQMGMSFMVTDTRAAETAAAKRLDATAENSTLATAGQGIEDAWNTALELHAWYLGIPKEGAPVMTINKDFDAVMLDAPTMTVYADAVARAGLDPMVMLEAWQRGGRIPADADLEQMRAEMMAGMAAKEAQAQMEADAMNDAGGAMPRKMAA